AARLMEILNKPLKELLSDRTVFSVFDDEFREAGWLDVTVLLKSESSLSDLYRDGTVPKEVLDRIQMRLSGEVQ
ncbi:MAG: hypothetical protein VZQ80_07180, partial [Lachnospiraceae bacterium]|nr:hypothetical protein [Lachnospiraceae bacterium]